MEGLFQVWKVEHTTIPKWEEPISEPGNFRDCLFMVELLREEQKQYSLEDNDTRIDCTFEIRPIHPEERF